MNIYVQTDVNNLGPFVRGINNPTAGNTGLENENAFTNEMTKYPSRPYHGVN